MGFNFYADSKDEDEIPTLFYSKQLLLIDMIRAIYMDLFFWHCVALLRRFFLSFFPKFDRRGVVNTLNMSWFRCC